MKFTHFALLSMIPFLFGCATPTPNNQAVAHDEIRQAITRWISLLESKQYYQYDLSLFAPDDLPFAHKDTDNLHKYRESLKKSWSPKTTKGVLDDLNYILNHEPKFNEDASVATFTVLGTSHLGSEEMIQLHKIGENWHLKTK